METRSTHATRAKPLTVIAASRASRVLPLPPAPVRVSSRVVPRRAVSSASSWSRPTKRVGYDGMSNARLAGERTAWATVLGGGDDVIRSSYGWGGLSGREAGSPTIDHGIGRLKARCAAP